MKRVYQKSSLSDVQKRAMEQYVETRAIIRKAHPGLLSMVRARITSEIRNPLKSETSSASEKIDRQKNLETVNKLLDITTSSMGFQKQVKAIITETSI